MSHCIASECLGVPWSALERPLECGYRENPPQQDEDEVEFCTIYKIHHQKLSEGYQVSHLSALELPRVPRRALECLGVPSECPRRSVTERSNHSKIKMSLNVRTQKVSFLLKLVLKAARHPWLKSYLHKACFFSKVIMRLQLFQNSVWR